MTGGTKKLQTTQGLNFVFFCTAQFVETNGLVKHNIYQELKQTITDLDLRITWKHPVYYYYYITIILFISIISQK